MESVGERAAGELGFVAGGTVVRPLVAVVQRTEQLVLLCTVEFDDVDLAAGCPRAVFLIGREHPDGGPDAFAGWQLGANLDFSVAPVASVLGVNPAGAEWALRALYVWVVSMCLEDEFAIFDSHIFGAIGVKLHFLIATTEGINRDTPLAIVQLGAVEFVRPDDLPIRCLGLFGQ